MFAGTHRVVRPFKARHHFEKILQIDIPLGAELEAISHDLITVPVGFNSDDADYYFTWRAHPGGSLRAFAPGRILKDCIKAIDSTTALNPPLDPVQPDVA
jgi:hypothetical protein